MQSTKERKEEHWLLIENKSVGAVQYFYDKVNQEVFFYSY